MLWLTVGTVGSASRVVMSRGCCLHATQKPLDTLPQVLNVLFLIIMSLNLLERPLFELLDRLSSEFPRARWLTPSGNTLEPVVLPYRLCNGERWLSLQSVAYEHRHSYGEQFFFSLPNHCEFSVHKEQQYEAPAHVPQSGPNHRILHPPQTQAGTEHNLIPHHTWLFLMFLLWFPKSPSFSRETFSLM